MSEHQLSFFERVAAQPTTTLISENQVEMFHEIDRLTTKASEGDYSQAKAHARRIVSILEELIALECAEKNEALPRS
jgi:hypothetical protein